MRGCCKNCKSHKDETNAEAAIGLLFGYFFFGFAVMGRADRAIERTLSRMTQSRPVPQGSERFRWFRALRHSGFGALGL